MSICDSPPVPVITYRPFITFRYNSMLNFIQVSFCFLLFLGLGLGLWLWSVIGLGLGFKVRVRGSGSGSIIQKKYLKIFDRWLCKHIGHSLSLDACFADASPPADCGDDEAVCKYTRFVSYAGRRRRAFSARVSIQRRLQAPTGSSPGLKMWGWTTSRAYKGGGSGDYFPTPHLYGSASS